MGHKSLLWVLIAILLAGATGFGLAARSIWPAQNSLTYALPSTTHSTQGVASITPNTYTTISINGTKYYALKVSDSAELVKGIRFRGVYFKKLPVTTTGCVATVIMAVYPDGYSRNLTAVYACTSTPIPEWFETVKHSGIEAGIYQRNGTLYLIERGLSGGEEPHTYGEFLLRLGDWRISINASSGKGVLTVEYVGNKTLKVSNPLLPLTAGLNVRLYYTNPSMNTVIRKSGMYVYNRTVEVKPYTSDSVSFNAEGLRLIRVEGLILGKIPVRILIPIESWGLGSTTSVKTPVVTVTVTETVTAHETTSSTQLGYCRFIKQGDYVEPPRAGVSEAELSNETVVSDGPIKVHIPLKVSEPKIPLTFENQGKSPLLINNGYVKYEIINVSEDGLHWKPVNYKAALAIPTTTIPPLPPQCRSEQPPNTLIIHGESSNLLKPGEKASLVTLPVPSGINGLEGLKEYWIYVKASISYYPVKAVYGIDTNVKPYLSKYLAISLYSRREVELIFRVHVDASMVNP